MKTLPRILVCGGRHFKDWAWLRNTLGEICDARGWTTEPASDGNYLPEVHIIHGGAPGADMFAQDWAVINWCDFTAFPVKKEDWRRLGKAAGPIRNKRMIDEGKPDLVVAFPGGRGTKGMVGMAVACGIEVIEPVPCEVRP